MVSGSALGGGGSLEVRVGCRCKPNTSANRKQFLGRAVAEAVLLPSLSCSVCNVLGIVSAIPISLQMEIMENIYSILMQQSKTMDHLGFHNVLC
jgi:hypothetical protein